MGAVGPLTTRIVSVAVPRPLDAFFSYAIPDEAKLFPGTLFRVPFVRSTVIGFVVDEPALIAALKDGRLGGAALDVFDPEPTAPERWADVPNTVLAPHHGGQTTEMLRRLLDHAVARVHAALLG